MKKIIFSIIVLSFCAGALAQKPSNVYLSGTYIDTPIKDFIREVEMKTSMRFFYQEDLIKDIRINLSGSNVDLIPVLSDQLKKAGLQIYNEGHNIFIYQGEQITTELPFYSIKIVEKKDTVILKSITETEKKYLEGQKVSPTKVLEIGDKQKSAGLTRCIVNGKIIDESNSEPLVGATVYIDELKTGTVADLEGRFKLALPPGKYKAIFSYMSMKKQEYYLQVYSTGSVMIEMKQELIALKEVRVTSNRYDNVKGMQMGFEKISVKAIKEIPVVFGERDVIKIVQMLPGVLNVGEGSSGFNVRGSAEDQNMFYIDKIPVYNTSHLFGFFTSFNPDIINDFSFYKSNIPASYGGRLSSVFDIKTRQGNKKKLFFQGGISPITAHSSIEIPVVKDKVSVVSSFRSSYSDWILKMIRDKDLRKSSGNFYDGSFSVNAEINDKNLLKAFVYLSRDKFSLSSINDYDYSNTGSSFTWKHIISPSISSDFSVIYSNYSYDNVDKSILSTAYTQKYKIDHYETRQDLSILTRLDHKIEFGASEIYYNLDRGNISPFGEQSSRIPFSHGKERGVEIALYLSDEFSLFRDLTVSTGIRYSIFGQFGPANVNIYGSENIRTIDNIKETRAYHNWDLIKSYSGPEYRFSLNYSIGSNSSVKASYNRLYQYIFMIRNAIAVSPDDKWKLCDYHIDPPVADQVSVGYYHDFNEGGIKASLELYHKWVNNQVGFKDGSDFASYNPIETQVLQGKQRGDGIELMLHKNTGKTTGWVSYCYSRSFIRVDGGLSENQINNGIEYPSDYDRPHSFNLVFNYRTNRRLSFSSNFVYTTGRPMTCPVSVYYSEGQQLLNFSKRNEFRIPDYIRLDVSVNIEGNLLKKKPVHGSWSLSAYNVLGRRNSYSVFFDEENGRVHGHKLAIFGIPIVTLSWICKFGNYLND